MDSAIIVLLVLVIFAGVGARWASVLDAADKAQQENHQSEGTN